MRAVEGFTRKFDKDRNRIKTQYHPPANANRIKQIVELGPDSGCDYVTTEFSTYSTPLIEAVRKGKLLNFKLNQSLTVASFLTDFGHESVYR